jgi:hypothetical protein
VHILPLCCASGSVDPSRTSSLSHATEVAHSFLGCPVLPRASVRDYESSDHAGVVARELIALERGFRGTRVLIKRPDDLQQS